MGKYLDSDAWSDVVPSPQDDGCANPLAAIAYSENYSEAMSYLRAVMWNNEKSDRALKLTENIIEMNPAHYTVWIYRADILIALKKDLLQELKWLDSIALKHIKNFQIWHHRQVVMSHVSTLPRNEIDFLGHMFAKDVKNYHVWSYRQWLVRHFSLWDTELPYVERLLGEDVRNNSAWNHRWFVVFARHTDPKQHSIKNNDAHSEVSLDIVEREIEYAEAKITIAPQNQSPWLYLKGVLRKQGRSIVGLKAFAKQFADLANPDKVTSSHALDVLADVYAEEKDYLRSAQAFDLLATKKDNIRKNYWDYRRSKLPIVA